MPFNILVVDDEPDLELLIRQKFRRQIRDQEFTFEFARNGVEALEMLAANRATDLVLTDINMPEMDGLTLLAKIGELDVLLKSVIVSAYGDMGNIRTAMNRGAADFLVKPIDLQDLEITVRKTLLELVALREAIEAQTQLLALRNELEIAATIQRSMLPRSDAAFSDRLEFEIAAEMVPAREVGGDLYDFFLIDDDHLGFLIGDVSGKGVPAAIFMATSRTLLKSSGIQGLAPDPCLEHVNDLLCLDNSSEQFVTVFYGILKVRTGEIAYSVGGHNPPYVLRRDGTVECLAGTGGTVLGVLRGIRHQTKRTVLARDETIFLYTDGITEAMDREGRLFSEARLRQSLERADRDAPKTVIRHVLDDVKAHSSGAPQSDDITALAIRYAG